MQRILSVTERVGHIISLAFCWAETFRSAVIQRPQRPNAHTDRKNERRSGHWENI